jgi:hypothetical protein
MATDPISGARYPLETDSGDVALWMQRGVNDLSTQGKPRFSTTTARDNAYSAAITAGTITSIADGTECVVNGVPYRRINGNWRQDNGPRVIYRITAPSSAISSGGGNETGVTSGIAALANFTLYEAATVGVDASFRAGAAGSIATCYVKINGAQVGNSSITRSDNTCSVTGAVALAAGTYSVAAHVDASGAIVWTDAFIKLTVGQAE